MGFYRGEVPSYLLWQTGISKMFLIVNRGNKRTTSSHFLCAHNVPGTTHCVKHLKYSISFNSNNLLLLISNMFITKHGGSRHHISSYPFLLSIPSATTLSWVLMASNINH